MAEFSHNLLHLQATGRNLWGDSNGVHIFWSLLVRKVR
jgi:hypothetical protein